MDITTLTIDQLKALAYDELVKFNISKANLEMVEMQIKKLSQVPTETPEEIKE